MQNRMLFLGCAMTLIASAAVAQSANEVTMRAEEAFGEYDASVMIRFSSDTPTLPISEDAIGALLESTTIGEVALQEALGTAYPTKRISISFGYTELGKTMEKFNRSLTTHHLGRIWIDGLDGDVITATKAIDVMIERLQNALENASTADHAALMDRLSRTKRELSVLQDQLATLEDEGNHLHQQAGYANLFRNDVANQMQQWQDELRELELQVEHNHAQSDVVSRAIAEVAAQIEERVAADSVTKELGKVIELREKELARTRELHNSGHQPSEALTQAMERVVQARIEKLARHEELKRGTGHDQLGHLNMQLQQLTMDAASAMAKIGRVQALLEEANERDVLKLAARYENDVHARREMLSDQRKMLHRELMELEDRLRGFQPPRLTVIGGASDAPGR